MDNKKMRVLLIIQIISLVITSLIVGGITLYYLERKSIPENLNVVSEKVNTLENDLSEIKETIDSIDITVYVPKKNVDYFDGKDGVGIDGEDGKDGINGINGTDGEKGDTGEQGITPIIRCNVLRNRWEVKHSELENWRLLNNEVVKCTIKEVE